MRRPVEKIPELLGRIRSLRSGPKRQWAEELRDSPPEDVAAAIARLPREDALAVLEGMDVLQAAEVMVELPEAVARDLARHLPDDTVAAYLDVLPMDDALDLAEELEPERLEAMMLVIPEEDAAEIGRLMQFPKGSVGRVMTERFFEVSPETTVSSLLEDLRQASDEKYETVNDVYVLGPDRELVGLFSLRRALRAAPGTPASELMRTEFETAEATEPAEDAARRMSRYGFYALPVTDASGRMIGLFTGDDAQAILTEAESADVLALGGVSGSGDAYMSLTVWQLVRRRLPWLMILFVAETMTGAVIRHYTKSGQEDGTVGLLALMAFVPLIIGAGGNAGSQVTTTITRAIALRDVVGGDWLRVLGRELVVATGIGVTLGAIGTMRAVLWGGPAHIPVIVGISLPLVVVWAATVGSLLPLAAKRVGIDPAVMSAPFITTFVDATGLIIFFEVARQVVPAYWR
jgi:magnesium transporter